MRFGETVVRDCCRVALWLSGHWLLRTHPCGQSRTRDVPQVPVLNKMSRVIGDVAPPRCHGADSWCVMVVIFPREHGHLARDSHLEPDSHEVSW